MEKVEMFCLAPYRDDTDFGKLSDLVLLCLGPLDGGWLRIRWDTREVGFDEPLSNITGGCAISKDRDRLLLEDFAGKPVMYRHYEAGAYIWEGAP